MILGVLDFESTGVDPLQDRVIEVGKILYSTGQKRVLESEGFLVRSDRPVPKEVEDLTGITNAAIKKYGYDEGDTLRGIIDWMRGLDAIAGHNINQFDWEILQNWACRHGLGPLAPRILIDTMWDLPGVRGRKLKYMCADDGFLLSDAHEALNDCRGTLKLIENRLDNLDNIIARAKSPIIVLQSLQDRDHNEQAKKREFHWNDQPAHIWWRACKEIDVTEIAKEAPFDVCIRRDLSLKELWS